MSANNLTGQKYIFEYAGDPTGISTAIVNPPKGALVINNLTGDWYQKTTGYGDNSGYVLILSAASSTVVPTFSNVRLALGTITAGLINFTGAAFQTATLSAPITFTTSNLAIGRSVTVRIVADASERAFTFPAWRFIGSAAPATIAASKTAILTLTSFGTTDANVYAAYAAEP